MNSMIYVVLSLKWIFVCLSFCPCVLLRKLVYVFISFWYFAVMFFNLVLLLPSLCPQSALIMNCWGIQKRRAKILNWAKFSCMFYCLDPVVECLWRILHFTASQFRAKLRNLSIRVKCHYKYVHNFLKCFLNQMSFCVKQNVIPHPSDIW